jgi:hypothetical protein
MSVASSPRDPKKNVFNVKRGSKPRLRPHAGARPAVLWRRGGDSRPYEGYRP